MRLAHFIRGFVLCTACIVLKNQFWNAKQVFSRISNDIDNDWWQVVCKNKREGKQLSAQAILQLMHPQLTTWGSLLRLYAKSNEIKEKKVSSQSIKCCSIFFIELNLFPIEWQKRNKRKSCRYNTIQRSQVDGLHSKLFWSNIETLQSLIGNTKTGRLIDWLIDWLISLNN